MNLSPRRRWLLFALALTASILNLVDRQIIAVLKPVIAADLGWSDNDYGTLAAWFQGAAAFAFLFTGWIVDRLGVKWANPLGVVTWSLAAIAHAWAWTMGQFILVRAALGATEAMGTPSGVKTIATIFPPHLRSTAFGLSNAVGSIGAILTPLAIPLLAALYGWRAAFVIAGLLGVVWAALWLIATRGLRFDTSVVTRTVSEGQEDVAPDYGPIVRDRRTWAIAVAKVLSDSTWWLMLFWMPDFFNRQFGLSGTALGPPLAVAYTGAAIGSIIAGSLATRLLVRGMPLNRVRKGAMLASALVVVPVPLALHAQEVWLATAILALALAGHQGFSTTLFAVISDVTPQAKVGRVTAFGAFCGNLGGMAIAKIAGVVLTAGLGYGPLFLFASVSYLLALGWIHLLLPRIRRAEPLADTNSSASPA
ncbi:MFS transporter [Novosphingobium sp. JCM 18896]|uniref:MFS transporter n=1 Tax=Novosphingobium sp. JCM 18896 TaxID=2989731 RepID=UPI00222164AE|nr:MFS transporter [Novosphingobium sp. JCM 18896]MCW1428636.1 MFS transporter [Novosphingobium sp. JCM 18896]